MGQDEVLALIEQAGAEGWTELNLAGRELTEIPERLSNLTNLIELYLHGNQISEIPESLSNLTNLTTLDLYSNQIREISESFSNLTNLTRLDLSINQISEIPESLSNLTNLTWLSLRANQISEIPESLSNLTNLTTLDLSINQISEIPESLSNLTNLIELYLRANQISEIPESLSNLTNLTRLSLASNQISEIPESLSNLTNLIELYLYKNQISEIPESLSHLTNLATLWLVNNQISKIPESLSHLTNLATLYLANNQISEIPESLSHLTSLTELYLSDNQISKIPESLSNLTNLTELYLYKNQISEIPESFSNLTNLTRLWLSNNQISEIPESLSNLTNLTTLSLHNNQITEIPKAIGNLTSLTILDLENNRITKIPETIQNLLKLEELDLRGNPISIPPDILALQAGQDRLDARPILDYYFRTQDPKETTNLYEVKILIVGEGGSGKTSLAKKLIDPDYQLKPETEDISTQGIDILRWEFVGHNQQTYKVNIWDFGGQEIYHQTHQFFLTDRSLYLLVADSRKEDTDHYFWLQIIRLLSDESPVLLIQNEKQNRTCNLSLRELRAEFTNLETPPALNLADNRGLAKIQAAIQRSLEDLLPQGMPFPNSWLKVRYTLENDGRNYIECHEYEATCRSQGITRREEMYDLSRFLHSLGVCLHFQKDPILRHRLILKPNWGTTAVYKILDNDRVKKNLGQFSKDDLAQIWQANQYADMHHELLQLMLMKEFKVCYEIPRRPGNYIAPHLLAREPCDYDWDENHNLILRYRYKGFMPKGILTRFIVEMHELIENVSEPDHALVWKYGVVLNQGRTRAEIIERPHDREIHLRLSGSHQRDFMATLNYEFYKIHRTYERLDYDTLIPCNCAICKTMTAPYTYTLDDLRRYLDNRRLTIECRTSFEQVNVRRLLDDSINPNFDQKFYKDDHELDLRSRERFSDRPIVINNNISNSPTAEANAMSQESKYTNNLQGANIANLVNEANDEATITATEFTQNSTTNTTELLQIVNNLRQTAAQFPPDIQEGIIIDLDDVETEIKKPENKRNLPRLKKYLAALLAVATLAGGAIASGVDFANNVVDLGSKVGIELKLPTAP
jgi:internalin A